MIKRGDGTRKLIVGTDAYCAVSLCHFVTSPSHREEVFPGGPPQDGFREGTEALPYKSEFTYRRGELCSPARLIVRSNLRDVEDAVPYNKIYRHNIGIDAGSLLEGDSP